MLERDKIINLIRNPEFSVALNQRITPKMATLPRGAEVHCGASKNCLVLPNRNYVVKWCRSTGGEECQREIEVYQEAIKSGLEFLFPKTTLLMEYADRVFIVQEKVDCCCCDMSNAYFQKVHNITKTVTQRITDKAYRDIVKQGLTSNDAIPAIWLNSIISLYGKHVCKELCTFIQEQQINDLHQGNVGFKKYKPILIDFCGYWW